jgi:hypothetical protein
VRCGCCPCAKILLLTSGCHSNGLPALCPLVLGRQGLPAVDACDDDVLQLCAGPDGVASFVGAAMGRAWQPLGYISGCLQRQVEQDRLVADQGVEAAPGMEAAHAHEGHAGHSLGDPDPGESAAAAEGDGDGDSSADGERRRARSVRRLLGQASGGRRRRQQEDGAGAAGAGPGGVQQEGAAAEAAQAEAEQQPEAPAELMVSPACRALLDVALLPNAFEEFEGSLTATAVVTQLGAIKSSLGLKHGTLHNPGTCTNSRRRLLAGAGCLQAQAACRRRQLLWRQACCMSCCLRYGVVLSLAIWVDLIPHTLPPTVQSPLPACSP